MELLFGILLLIGIICLPFFLQRPHGEPAVASKIESLIKRNSEYRLFNDIILKTLDGTTQIDHLIISPYGIFVIETKNLSGWIFGDPHQKKWTQSLKRGRWQFYKNTFQFQNPIHQNYKHVKAVQNFLKVDSKSIFNIVVFAGNSRFMTDMPDNVMGLHNLIPYVEARAEKIIHDERVGELCQRFTDYMNNAPITFDDHMRNLERNMAHPTCPKCGISMVIRTARKGVDVGSEFWGCKNYPSCKTTRRLSRNWQL